MAKKSHLQIVRRGVESWNEWRQAEAEVRPNLRGADLHEAVLHEGNLNGVDLSRAELWGADLNGAQLSEASLFDASLPGADLSGANLRRANLSGANLTKANLNGADLSGANLRRANLSGANLTKANLNGADLVGARLIDADLTRAGLTGAQASKAHLTRALLDSARLSGAELREADLSEANLGAADLSRTELWGANLTKANLNGADLSAANLYQADLTGADLTGADLARAHLVESAVDATALTGARVYGISAWNLQGTPKSQADLVITRRDEPVVTVDDLKVAQFIYLLLSNPNIRDVIDTITSKVVLILGCFAPERKRVLDALRDELRKHNLTPVLFDFDIPSERDITETITLLARMARFIIADLTDPASIPMELQAIAPDVAVPIRSIVHQDQEPFSMFHTLRRYHWVMEPYRYAELDALLANLDSEVIAPADAKRTQLNTGAGS